jgi:pyruvate,orthophosphate dikinase
MIDPKQLDALLHPQFEAKALKNAKSIGSGLAASPGAACGRVVFTAADAVEWGERGEKVILVRLETSPEDIAGMHIAQGILTARGGMTSHAAVVARGMGTCCVAGCGDLILREEKKHFTLGGKTINEGDWISLDGTTGQIYGEALPTVEAEVSGDFARLIGWADGFRKLKVRTNADTPQDAAQAVRFGAEGIGLTRTEHMFFAADRIGPMREMIVSKNEQQRRTALEKLLPMQRSDFEGIYLAMEDRPVTIRLLDPPLHEFLPTEEGAIDALAAEMKITPDDLKNTIRSLHQFTP